MATVLGDHVTESIRAEDESEWEYEYSTTETEVSKHGFPAAISYQVVHLADELLP